MYAIPLIAFCFIFIVVKGFRKSCDHKAESCEFQELNDPGNFINPFNEYNK
jgi:hypothetical protein